MFNARSAFAVLGLLALAAVLVPAEGAEQKRPNIIMIMGDDVGMWNLSAYHHGMMGGSTPNIDRIL